MEPRGDQPDPNPWLPSIVHCPLDEQLHLVALGELHAGPGEARALCGQLMTGLLHEATTTDGHRFCLSCVRALPERSMVSLAYAGVR